jgi:hypothetical protein
MMEDEKVAKLFLSAIIKEKVVELDFAAQERIIRHPKSKKGEKKAKEENEEDSEEQKEELFFTVCRFDFSAKIELADGSFKTIVIELQKAKLTSDIMRFRRYLGLHYQNPQNTYKSGDEEKARQIYCIFILGHDICVKGAPVLKVYYSVEDTYTEEVVEVEEYTDFIKSLHHLSWIIQVKQLKQRRRNVLEKLLSIFDQDNITKDHHILNVNEDEFPEEYRFIIRRLRMASESEDVQIQMEMEDDFMKELQDKERLLSEAKEKAELREQENEELKKEVEEKDKFLQEQAKFLQEQAKEIEELKKELAAMRKQN